MPVRQKRILIVDDEKGDAFVLETTLKALARELFVVGVCSAEEALEKLRDEPFDLVVTDLRMPGMDGLELMRQVSEAYPETGTMLVTAFGSEEIEAEVGRLEGASYLPKPFPMAEFARTVARALQLDRERVPGPSPPTSRTEAVQRALLSLRRGTGARCVLLVDGEGNIAAQAGTVEGLPLEAILPVLAEERPISACMDRQLGGAGMSLHHYEGEDLEVHAAVDNRIPYLLVVVGQQGAMRRSGMVWIFLRRTLQELRGLVRAGYLSSASGSAVLGSLTLAQARAMGLLPDEADAGEGADER